jgi:hypothetical protein
MPLQEGDGFVDYSRLLHHWTHAMLITIEHEDSVYKFPLRDEDLVRAAKLKEALKGDPRTIPIDAFHNFIKPLLYPKTTGRPEGDYSRWDDPFECLFALSALREDGWFKPANLITQTYAQMKYHIRGAILYEGFKVHRLTGMAIYKCVPSLSSWARSGF